jgi:hypothetical protein
MFRNLLLYNRFYNPNTYDESNTYEPNTYELEYDGIVNIKDKERNKNIASQFPELKNITDCNIKDLVEEYVDNNPKKFPPINTWDICFKIVTILINH